MKTTSKTDRIGGISLFLFKGMAFAGRGLRFPFASSDAAMFLSILSRVHAPAVADKPFLSSGFGGEETHGFTFEPLASKPCRGRFSINGREPSRMNNSAPASLLNGLGRTRRAAENLIMGLQYHDFFYPSIYRRVNKEGVFTNG